MVEWIPLPRDSSLCATELLPAAEHPLTAEHPAAAPPNQLAAAPRSPEPIPLADDPLTAALQAETETEAVLETGPAAKFSDAALSNAWRSRKQAILSKFTTTQKIAVQEVFGDREDPLVALGSSVEVGPRMMNSAAVLLKSQTEFQEMVRGYEQRLEKFWDQEDKVSALKVGIQCVKFIANSSVGWFYPFKYVLIKDVLDKLSERVYARLKGLGLKNPERDDFLSSEIAPAAKVVGNNWIYKVSCIRELLPRLYSELALIPCYRMMDHADIAQILVRIASTIRGIGDPIVSSFCRAYLASQVLKLRLVKYNMKMVYRDCLLVAMDDTMSILYLLLTSKAFSLSNMLVKVESNSELLEVISPAIAWIMYTFAEDASEDELLRVVDAYKKKSNHGFFLYHIVDSFPASFVSKHAILFCDLASCAVNDDFKPYLLFRSLGQSFIEAAPSVNRRLEILNKIWKLVRRITASEEYIQVAEVFVQYLIEYFGNREVNIFLNDVVRHVKRGQAYLNLQTSLSKIFQAVLNTKFSLQATLSMDSLLPLLDLIVDKQLKRIICKSVLQSCFTSNFRVSDAIVSHALLKIAKNLHDSMDDLSAASERDEVIELIAYLLYNINYGNDLEQHLNTLVDARKSLPNFDPVTSLVVHDINKLVMQAHRITRGKHTAETLSFVKTAIAICHITIPSVLDPIERMHLFLCSAEVALINHLISQAEGLLKAAIKEIPSLPSDFEAARLCDWVQKFLSFSIMFPGHPVHGPFYLIKGLLNALEAFLPWVNNISKAKTRIYMDLVAVCCAYYQIKLPYGISGVDSNDVLFGGSQSYLKEVDDMLQRTFENIFDQIQLQSGAPELQSELCLLVANQITSHLTMNEYAADRVFRLIKLFLKNTESGNSTAAFQHTMENLCARNGTLYRLIYDRIKQIV